MAGVTRVRQVIEQAKTTFKKAKGDATFQEEFERLKSLVSLYTPYVKLCASRIQREGPTRAILYFIIFHTRVWN